MLLSPFNFSVFFMSQPCTYIYVMQLFYYIFSVLEMLEKVYDYNLKKIIITTLFAAYQPGSKIMICTTIVPPQKTEDIPGLFLDFRKFYGTL